VDRGFDAWDPGPHLLTPGDERNGDLDARLDALAAGEGPFFLFAHYADPHEPYNPHDADGAARPLRVTLDGQPVAEASLTAMRTVEAELLAEPGEHVLELAAGEDFRLRHLRLEDSRGELALVLEEGALGEAAPRVRARFTVTPGDGPVQLTAWVHDVPPEEAIPARYAAEVAFADAAVGRLLDGLRERGLYETSTIVFTSDHGEALGEHGCFGHIVNLYDEMLHVPLVIKPARGHPATRRLRARSGDLVGHVDLAPTVLDLLGLPRFDGVAGTSLLARADHPLLAETRRPEAPRDLLALRDLRYKLVYDVDLDSFELYDLSTDPGELVNVYEQRIHERSSWPARLRELAATPPGVAAPGISPDTEIRARLRALGYTGQ
jgi:membrane-anchored protein YejM (alkaline phosphatase superfamily)